MGDVSFRLTPSPDSLSLRRSPSPRKASPSQRRRPLRAKSYVNSSTEPTSPPILSIRQAPISSSSPRSIRKSSFVSPGHVRGIKERFELQQQENRRRSSIFSSQVAADNGSSTTGYFVDLHSFTGTLQITPSNQNIAPLKPKKVYSPIKRAAGSQNDDSITNRRVKKRSLTPVKQSRKENEIGEMHDTAANKSVQFSLTSTEELNSLGYDTENNDNVLVRNENKGPTTTMKKKQNLHSSPKQPKAKSIQHPPSAPLQKQNLQNSPVPEKRSKEKSTQRPLSPPVRKQSPESSSPVPEKLSKAKSLLISPPPLSALASPPLQAPLQATARIARETSSALARSSKFALKQIASVGKDAYDMLHGDAPPNYSAHINELSQASFDSLEDQTYDAFDGTDYHYACASDSLEDIRTLLDDVEGDGLFYLWKTDCNGKLPLHVLTENVQLIEEDPVGCEEVAICMIELMGPANLVYALCPNSLWAPFISTLGRWTERLHGGGTSMKFRNTTRAISENDQNSARENPGETTQPRMKSSYFALFGSTVSTRSQPKLMTDTEKLMILPVNVKMNHHVLWSIRMLSRLIDEYPEQTREFIMTNLATVPLFLKSVLLLSNFDEMQTVLETSLVSHAVLDKRSINVWLIAMLTSNRESRYRAVTFIKLLSRLTLVDLVDSSTSSERFSDAEIERFVRNREETFTCIRNLPGLFPAVLALGKGLETLSTSRVLRYVTASTIRKSTSFFVLLSDFFYAIFLLMGYRLHVEFALSYDSVDGPVSYRDYKFLSIPMNFISGYFLLKEAITVLSLYLTSETLARRYCSSWGNILDVASAVMVLSFGGTLLYSASLLENQGFVASMTMMLLWLRIINQYKIMNSSFALFVYSVKEVIRKVKWFLLFLLAAVFMFSDAVRAVVAARGDCLKDSLIDDPYIQEFCSDGFIATTVRMYSVLVGDVSLEYFQSSGAMVTVFVFFSFFSIIILFNILIAIIISAYESTKERTREIFGRARVEYAAHLIARKQFMSPTETSDFRNDNFVPRSVRKCVRVAYIVISACALFAVEYGFAGAVYYLMLEHNKDMIRSLMIVYVSVGAVFNVYIASVAATSLFLHCEKFSPSAGGKVVNRLMRGLETAVSLFHQLLGFNEDMALDLSDDVDEVKSLGNE